MTSFPRPLLFESIKVTEVHSRAVRVGRMVIFHLSKLWKATLFTLCDVMFLVRLQGHSCGMRVKELTERSRLETLFRPRSFLENGGPLQTQQLGAPTAFSRQGVTLRCRNVMLDNIIARLPRCYLKCDLCVAFAPISDCRGEKSSAFGAIHRFLFPAQNLWRK